MKKSLWLLMSCLIFTSSFLNVNAADICLEKNVQIYNGSMEIKGRVSANEETDINCVIKPKDSLSNDLSSVVYIKEKKSNADGAFSFDFKFDNSFVDGTEYSVYINGENCQVETFDFKYYNYENILQRLMSVSSTGELEELLCDSDNTDALDFLGINTIALNEQFVNKNDLFSNVYEKIKNGEDFEQVRYTYTSLLALQYINNRVDGWIEKTNISFEGEKFAQIVDSNKKQWLSNKIYANAEYNTIDELQDKFTELSIMYELNNAPNSEINKIISDYYSELGIQKSNYKSKYSNLSSSKKVMFAEKFSTQTRKDEINSYEDFLELFDKLMEVIIEEKDVNNGGGTGNKAGNISYISNSLGENNGMNGFTDIGSVEWAQDAIEYLTNINVLSGFGDGTFRPDELITREQFVKIAVTAFNIKNSQEAACTFSDVNKNDWFYDYVAAASQNNIINGISDTEFGAGTFVSREDVATILHRIAVSGSEDVLPVYNTYRFIDDNTISDYAKEAVYSMYHAGIINGVGNDTFAPKQYCTRAQAAKLVYFLLTKGE